MKLIIPMAGKSPRLKPHTQNRPKELLELAGKPIIGHLLESVSKLRVDTVIFIVDEDKPTLKKYISDNYSFEAKYILQKERKGVGHAIYGAKKYVDDDEVVIIFADTIISADLKKMGRGSADGIIWTKKVEDPRNYGVVFEHEGKITRLIEKPETPVSDQAIVGLYQFRNGKGLFEALKYLITNDIKTKEEYQLTDALQIMINKKFTLISKEVEIWKDLESPEALIETNNYLLKKLNKKYSAPANCVVVPPVFIGEGTKIYNSIIGPNVSIGKNARINNSIIKNSIIKSGAEISDSNLEECIIGKKTRVEDTPKKLNIGDSSEVEFA